MTRARQTREEAGLTIEVAARLARVSSDYLRRIERLGGCSYPLALRLARLYRCSANVFITRGGETSDDCKQKRKGLETGV